KAIRPARAEAARGWHGKTGLVVPLRDNAELFGCSQTVRELAGGERVQRGGRGRCAERRSGVRAQHAAELPADQDGGSSAARKQGLPLAERKLRNPCRLQIVPDVAVK